MYISIYRERERDIYIYMQMRNWETHKLEFMCAMAHVSHAIHIVSHAIHMPWHTPYIFIHTSAYAIHIHTYVITPYIFIHTSAYAIHIHTYVITPYIFIHTSPQEQKAKKIEDIKGHLQHTATHEYVWRDSHESCLDAFICMAWLIHTCDMTHSYVWHDSWQGVL